MIVVLALLIAGFMARRLMMPGAARYLSHRAPDYPAAAPHADGADSDGSAGAARGVRPNGNGSGEHLNDNDRRALDEVIRRKTGGN
jgi:hypothetical protein